LAKTIKRTGYKIFTGLSEDTFKVLSDLEAELRGWASREGPRAMDTGTKGKGAGDSTSEDLEKQPGDDPMEAQTLEKHTSQAAVKGILVEPEHAAKRNN
jgi:hypothetical protein